MYDQHTHTHIHTHTHTHICKHIPVASGVYTFQQKDAGVVNLSVNCYNATRECLCVCVRRGRSCKASHHCPSARSSRLQPQGQR